MSTRSIIGTYDNKEQDKWHGVYHHFDGYPTGVGSTLLSLLKKKGVDFIRNEIIEKHPEGWSTINENWNKKPVNGRKTGFDKIKAPTHYDPSEAREFFNQDDEPGTAGAEYLYLVHNKRIDVFCPLYIKGEFKGKRMIGAFGMGAPNIGKGKDVIWKYLGTITKRSTGKSLEKMQKTAEQGE